MKKVMKTKNEVVYSCKTHLNIIMNIIYILLTQLMT